MSTISDQITVLVSTSPIPSHPDPAITLETLASLLGHGETIVMADGVRPEQEHRRADYEEYQRRLLWACGRRHSTWVLRSEEFRHQAGMTRWALEQVRTPLVLAAEHDTPLVGHVPWDELAQAILTGAADVVRLSSEARVLPEWEYLMCGEREVVCGAPMQRTAQWSQRPFLASTPWYRAMLDEFFPPEDCRTFVEDRYYGVVATPWVEQHTWGEHCALWLYTPTGDIKRSYHLDGRAGDEKWV